MEKNKLTALQMSFLIYIIVIPSASVIAQYSERDFWLSPILASFIGIISIWLALALHRKFPDMTFFQYTEVIAGKWIGKIINVIYIVFFIQYTSVLLRQYGDLIKSTLLPHTPIIVVIASMLLVCAYALAGGIHVIGKAAELFIPWIIVTLVILILSSAPDMHPGNMLPLLEDGLVPVMKGAIIIQGWFSQLFTISLLLPYMKKSAFRFRRGIASLFLTLLILVSLNFFTLFIFGDLTNSFVYSIYTAVRYIALADFYEHIEAVVLIIWVSSIFLKISLFYFVIVAAIAHMIKLPNEKPIILPIGYVLGTLSIWIAPNFNTLSTYLNTISPYQSLLFFILIPGLLYIIYKIKSKLKQGKEGCVT